jgi:hypothetical protein
MAIEEGALTSAIARREIEEVRDVIRPYVRVTPVVAVNGGDFGLGACPVTLKLELCSIRARSRRAARSRTC